MVGRFLRYLEREVGGLHEAAYLLATFTLLSQVVALVRDRLFAHEFGASLVLDVYYAAFRVPDVIFASVSSLVSISVLVPLLIEAGREGEEGERRFTDSIFTFFSLLIILVSIAVFFAMPTLMEWLFAPLVEAGRGGELVLTARVMLLSPLLLGISNFFASIMQVRKRFIAYALSPVFYNIGIVLGILFLYKPFGVPGLAVGVVFGAFMHMAIQLPYLVRHGFLPRLRAVSLSVVRRVVSLSIYRTIALSSTHIALIILVSMASSFAVGSVAIFSFAWNLQSVPLAMVGASYSVALFPAISRLFAEKKREQFVREISSATRHIIFWSLPIMSLFIVLRAQIIRTILGSGEFSWADTRLTAAALALFTVSILAQSLSLIFVRSYYAAGNTKTPLVVNVTTSALVILFAFLLLALISSVPSVNDFFESLLRVETIFGTAVLVLPLAYSLAMIVNLIVFTWCFERDFGGFVHAVSETFFHSFSAAVLAGAAAYGSLNVLDDVFDLTTGFGVFFQGFLAGLVGVLVALLTLVFLKSNELREIVRALHHKIWKKELVVSEQEASL